MDWTEIKVTVDTSTVEVVTNHIHEAGAGGIVIQHHGGNSSVTAYFPQGSETEHFLAGLTEFGDCLDIVMDVQCAVIADQDWSREWKKHYQPIQVGRVYITPSWLASRPQADIVVELDPGMAFGTGIHPTTQMCINELQATVSRDSSLLDLGTGSGLLSIVAAKLGAAQIDAVDNDKIAVDVALENARRNNCSIEPRQGDAFEIFRHSTASITVANIGFDASARLADIFVQENKDCTLILSGFPQERMSELKSHAAQYFARSRVKNGWGCLTLGRL